MEGVLRKVLSLDYDLTVAAVACDGQQMRVTFISTVEARLFVERASANETLVAGGVNWGCLMPDNEGNISAGLRVRTVLRRVVSVVEANGAAVTLLTTPVDHSALLRHARARFSTNHYPTTHFMMEHHIYPAASVGDVAGRQLAEQRELSRDRR